MTVVAKVNRFGAIGMLAHLRHTLTNPTFYLKWSRRAIRPFLAGQRRGAPVLARDFETPRRVEVYIAHPDDETFCSGLLCELVARDVEVHLNCLTRGEGGRTGGRSRNDLGRIREAEMRAAARELGAASLTFLGFVDPVANPFRIYAPDVSVNQLARMIARHLEQSAPDWVITHGSSGEYWHPAHILLHRAVARAWAARARQRPSNEERGLALVTFNAWHEGVSVPGLLNRDDVPTLCLDVSAHAGQRIRMMRAHETQATLMQSWAGSLENYVGEARSEYYRISADPGRLRSNAKPMRSRRVAPPRQCIPDSKHPI